jgi:hypothetical protein
MEVKVRNVSKLAKKDVLRELFGIVGCILSFEHYPDVITRDGSYGCDIVYANLVEARRALQLDGTPLGDRSMKMSLVNDSVRFRNHRTSQRVRDAFESQKGQLNTLLISRIPSDYDAPRLKQAIGDILNQDLQDFQIVRLSVEKEALLEFPSEEVCKKAFKSINDDEKYKFSAYEAWKLVDPDYLPIKKKLKSNRSKSPVKSRQDQN